MILWRISEHRELDGAGGLQTSARWHTQGRRIVYCGPNPASALVELLVHIEVDAEDLPHQLQYLEIHAPDTVSVTTIGVEALGRNWQTDDVKTRSAGDEWLDSGHTALLRVPSAIVPATWNILINPRHPQSVQIRVVGTLRHAIDRRLVR